MHVLMVAAENGALPGAKVGGIGDVIRDVPKALLRAGHQATVVTPGYQSLSQLPNARLLLTLTVRFAAALETLALYRIDQTDAGGVRHLVLEHPLFAACGAGAIYCHDAHEPFATDAAKFALFSTAVSHALLTQAIAGADVVHLHDWHAAPALLLRRYDPAYRALQSLPMVYTIHNLQLQGIRPFAGSWSSPATWFPHLQFERNVVGDPRWPDCINLMRVGINLADQVHVVSPRYAGEILLPSDAAAGLVRGEGLEADLAAVHAQDRLHGILNGCDYEEKTLRKPSRTQLLEAARATVMHWVDNRSQIPAAWFHAEQRLQQWKLAKLRESFVVASIGRLTPQKVRLLMVTLATGQSALDAILRSLGDGCLIMIGSGDDKCEHFMLDAMRRHSNFLFLCGYAEQLGTMLYHYCDAFLMPSSFEPCGISQLLALRAGKPVLVHAVGGLADTVAAGVNGFSFGGSDETEQATNL
ncbi:MAG TPA: glycogen/starch synthase, partial [Candidatus Acidoferrum sp.]|nr:glycogen/starch synthase [Candidatus Acidoferrum sp.]